ncbi:MAG: hypothetical protein A2735_00640 [Candidatus Yanofskybacteria bacterium RIFCSPHIGHO2_01_FULL_41_21]|uniref:Methyltransferase n=1 Tax=Candidatus Yanofskybacteria bacterium RIFCSPHIGHO2_01_FULL_41_21 TaxID=1802660 RepID=A0A1F8EBA6_9BACT|nr:MAG: hypothetical protein A2735_00640 [Candidatus Yanofskybacteria bacterium RIFCSPHIGHO2_01_FULL_41_21]
MAKKIRQRIVNFFIDILSKPSIRYRFLLPLSTLISKNPDEEILEKAMKFAAHVGIGGDYLEFGVWKGRSFARAYHMRKYIKDAKLNGMKFYAFDSFQGLPEIKNEHDTSSSEFKKGDYACDIGTFRHNLINKGVDLKEVTIIPGWYEETLNEETKNKLSLKKASIIFVDCDIYESAVSVLNFITDYVVNGTIIIFDDWFAFSGDPEKGEQRAFKEWLERNPNIKAVEWQRVNWKSNSFILNKSR